MERTRAMGRVRRMAVGVLVASVVLACSGEGDNEAAPGETAAADGSDEAAGGTDTDSGDADQVADEIAVEGGDGEADDAGDDGGEEAAGSVLDASDGWSEPHDPDVPDAGLGVLTVGGETYEFEASCIGPGEVPDHFMDGDTPLNEFVLFNFGLRGQGQTEEGQAFRVTAERGIWIAGDRYLNLQHAGYGGDGQFDLVSLSVGDDGVSHQQSPSSEDPEGALLPLVHVDQGGTVTAQGELAHEFETDETPEGEFTLAARCQQGWPDDVIDAAG